MTSNGTTSRTVDDFIRELLKAGVSPSHFAAFIKNMAGSEVVGGDDNIPGFEYAQRVSNAWVNALTAHGEEANAAWADIRRGRYGFGAAAQAWARLVDNYAGVVAQALRPSPIAAPTWVVIEFPEGEPRSPQTSTRVDAFLEKDTALHFAQIGGTRTDIFDGAPRGLGNRIEFPLNRAQLQTLRAGENLVYFLYRAGMGPVPPLVALVVRVTPATKSGRSEAN